MNILILGYYNRSNLGDEMFKISIPKLFKNSRVSFECVDDFKKTTDIYDAIICGGGDIINDYFYKKINNIVKNFEGPVFGLGIGIPYPGLIKKGYLDIYDHIFIRERTDLMKCQRRLGSQYCHYLPDLGFGLEFPPIDRKPVSRKLPKVGIFLAQSLYKYKSILFSLTQFILKISIDHEVIFFRFNTSGSELEDDVVIMKKDGGKTSG
jgi:hypothetical protein